MNKCFSKIWSASLGQVVVASELAHGAVGGSHDGSTVGQSVRVSKLAVALGSLLLGALPIQALAADAVCVDPVTGARTPASVSAAGNQVACGDGAVASGNNAIAIGTGATTVGASQIAIGNQAGRSALDGSYSIFIGDYAGYRSQGKINTFIGSNSGAIASGGWNVGVGSESAFGVRGDYNTAVGVSSGTSVTGTYNTALGASTGIMVTGNGNLAAAQSAGNYLTGDNNISFGPGSANFATGHRNVSNGYYAHYSATGDDNLALGTFAGTGIVVDANGIPLDFEPSLVPHSRSISIGTSASGLANDAIAIGTNSSATALYTTAIGVGAQSSAQNAIAIGENTQATNSNAVAMGTFVRATGQHSVAIGTGTASANFATVVGGNAIGALRDVAVGAGALTMTETGGGVIGTTGSTGFNTAIGTASGYQMTGTLNSYAGAAAGAGVAGSENVAMGAFAGSSKVYDPAADALSGATATYSNAVNIGSFTKAQLDNAIAIGTGATALASIGDVALGAGSVTAKANPTASGIINGVTYNYAGTAPTSVVSVGAVGAERQITNVAAGRVTATSTDAINGSQLYATNQAIAASQTHYYSVKGSALPQGNYNNDGATGNFAIAAGVNTTAAGHESVAMGYNARANNSQTVAIGSSAGVNNTATQSVLIGAYAGQNGSGSNNTAIGNMAGTSVTGIGNTAVGQSAGQMVNGTGNLTLGVYSGAGTKGNVNTSVGQYAGTNTVGDFNIATGHFSGTGTVGSDNVASGSLSGYNVTGDDNVSIGHFAGSNITLDKATGSLVGGPATYSRAVNIGTSSKALVDSAVAIGDGATAKASIGDVALGAGSVTAAPVNTGPFAIAGATAAATAPTSVVSVGNVGSERRITNVAAANLTSTSTDAINGSQLYATNMAVESGISFGDGSTSNNFKLGDTINVKGDANVTSTTTADGVQLGLANVVTIGGAAPVIINGDTGTIGGLTNKTFDPNNFTTGQAATEDQLAQINATALASKTTVTQGLNMVVTPTKNDDGSFSYEVATAKDVKFDTVQVGGVTIDGATNVISGVAAGALNATSTEAVNGSQLYQTNTTITNLGNTVAAGIGSSSTYNATTGELSTVLNVGGAQYTTIESAINSVNSVANAGWNLTANKGQNGSNVAPGGTVDLFNNDGNIVVTKSDTNDVAFDLAKNIAVDSVTAGNTTIDANGMTTTDGTNTASYGPTGMTLSNGTVINNQNVTIAGGTTINMGGNVVSGVGTGVAATDAVNVAQMQAAAAAVKSTVTAGDNIAVTTTTNADGSTNYAVSTAKDVAFDSVKVGNVNIDGTTGKISGLTAGDVSATSTDAVNGSQLFETNQKIDQVSQVANAGWNISANGQNETNVKPGASVDFNNTDGNVVISKSTANNDINFELARNIKVDSVVLGNGTTTINQNGLIIANGPSVTTGGINAGGMAITNVKAGTAATDAVNVSQLNAMGASTLNQANAYTDSQIALVKQDIWEVRRGYRGGTATALAAGNLPQAFIPGKNFAAIGFSTFQGETGMAIGVSGISDNARYIYKLSGSTSTNGEWGAAISAGMHW